MKALLYACLFAASVGSAVAAPAAGIVGSNHSAARPLSRYLTATLHLRRHKARLVQRAIQRNPLALSTPEQVAERLRPVLTAAQFERYTALQGNVHTYEMLNRLMAQR